MPKSKKFKSIPFTLILFIAIPVITVISAFVILSLSKTESLYVRIKASPGYWWLAGVDTNIWLPESVHKGDKQYDLFGKTQAEVVGVRYYPVAKKEDQYDLYVTARVNVSYNTKTQQYSFNRTQLVVGSPVDLDTTKSHISGTLVAMSKDPFEPKYVEKTVYLTKKGAYPWEYSQIKIGDKYFDGEDTVFEVIGKSQIPTHSFGEDYFGNNTYKTLDPNSYIIVKAKVKLKEDGDKLLFGEENVINSGSTLPISTPSFNYDDFYVERII